MRDEDFVSAQPLSRFVTNSINPRSSLGEARIDRRKGPAARAIVLRRSMAVFFLLLGAILATSLTTKLSL
jgi:hypothetical protein